ncbi:Serine/threonine-protein kinase [Rhynchospora pubera]|uniref:Receptor-like serine/threonine-protein kinase n=1 Tax=Rhynchospora pubera TaxID=906938 RepID=A0AAV8HKI3_9POAL|nr:Serine/threonine-protein kinase [Rhynchospora pubera]
MMKIIDRPLKMTVLVLQLVSLIFFSITNLCPAVSLGNTLNPGESLNSSQTLVSEHNVFQLGFISEDESRFVNSSLWVSSKVYYLAISFVKSPDTVIWKANRDNPINQTEFSLELSPKGNLVLYQTNFAQNQTNQVIWSSGEKASNPASTVLVLLDNGNLVIRDREKSSRITWQSFDHPTDAWLPGAPLGSDKFSGMNILLSYGKSSFEINSSRTNGFIIKKTDGNNNYSGGFPPWLELQKLDHSSLVTFRDNREPYLFIQLVWSQISIRWIDNSGTLKTLWYAPGCNYNFYSLSTQYDSCLPARDLCSGPDTLQTTSSNDGDHQSYIAGCSRNISLNCQNTSYSRYFNTFYLIKNVTTYPDNAQSLAVKTENECETACFGDCFCSAYVYQLYSNTCSLWFGGLQNSFIQDYVGDKLINVRVHNRKRWSEPLWVYTLIISFMMPLLVFVSLYCWRHKVLLFLLKQPKEEQGLVVYSYSQIKGITKNFSNKLGEGGFGSVFKGYLTNLAIVAVKRLKHNSSDEKQFRTEVRTIGMIHHNNLVKLLGFCSKGAQQMLVYECMPFGSLDTYLFSNGRYVINWKTRYQIMLGIAKGLTYLHQECVECIIHCDIKPENILLDEKICPKIADFGMAKLLSRDCSRVLTTMRGTIGYLAPEWLSGQPITQKADVYSFGLMLFEIISGRRNREPIRAEGCTYFPVYAAIKVNQSELLCLLDDKLEGLVNMDELDRACKVACWCIQDWEMERPSMEQVVRMLEGIVKIDMPPVPRELLYLSYIENNSSYYTFT